MQNHTKTNLPLQILADAANTLTRFLGVRDLPKLSHKTYNADMALNRQMCLYFSVALFPLAVMLLLPHGGEAWPVT